MEIQDCECYSDGLNYIVWQYREAPKGVFIIHIGGPNKRKLYRMMKELLQEEFEGLGIYFCTQQDSYWRNHSVLDGRYTDGTEVYRFTGSRLQTTD
jgi:hypothetical protein